MTFNELSSLLFPICGGDLNGRTRVQTLEKQGRQFLLGTAFLILANKASNVLARSTEAAVTRLIPNHLFSLLKDLRAAL